MNGVSRNWHGHLCKDIHVINFHETYRMFGRSSARLTIAITNIFLYEKQAFISGRRSVPDIASGAAADFLHSIQHYTNGE